MVVGGFSPTPLKNKNSRQNGIILPNFRGEHSKNMDETTQLL